MDGRKKLLPVVLFQQLLAQTVAKQADIFSGYPQDSFHVVSYSRRSDEVIQ